MDKEKKKKIKKLLTLSEEDAERQVRIKKIKKLIQKGDYKVNSQQIADKLLSEELLNEYILFYPIISYIKQKVRCY